MSKKKSHLKYKIAVSGAAKTTFCPPGTLEKAQELGREIARRGIVLVTGATTGFPYEVARGAKAEGGISIGFSPAVSEKEHVKTYKLPTDQFDLLVYTGFNYSGRNLIMTRAADAVIVGCARMGTLNEFTVAFEDQKPIGILSGTGELTEMIDEIIAEAHRGPGKVVYDSDPKKLVTKVLTRIHENDHRIHG
ncbi:LOG family protein [Candidatus Azambacteria bacterium]|nr:LOG family protein [Candidatus Azambacteria bacterium]